jgi:hypothetical protein
MVEDILVEKVEPGWLLVRDKVHLMAIFCQCLA